MLLFVLTSFLIIIIIIMLKVIMRSYEIGKGVVNMDNYVGDLTDIVRASGGTGGGGSQQDPASGGEWPSINMNNMNSSSSNSAVAMEDGFGDPFSVMMNDPLLLHGLDIPPNSVFFSGSGLVGPDSEDFMPHQQPPPIPNNNMYTRMLQMCTDPTNNNTAVGLISTCSEDRGGGDRVISIRVDKSKGCLVESSTAGSMMQISSPTNSGIKRRKSQAKKVVCIPAPATANSRATGEVVPSDLWAWRKYGQKPIKGSPYPRGYYRCSSSKGCSARKQVERSRTDPNMLVITYTSEHNHPWPTQRNALAGSTRSQPSSSSSKTINHNNVNASNSKQGPLKSPTEFNEVDASSPTTLNASLKEEAEKEPEMEMEEFGHNSYRPLKPDRADDFFADLGEITGDDPLGLLFSQGFAVDGQKEGNKGLDPFSIFDWSIDEQNSAFGEAKTYTTKPRP